MAERVRTLEEFERWCRRNKVAARKVKGPSQAQLAEYDALMDSWAATAREARRELEAERGDA